MATEFGVVFETLKAVLAGHAKGLGVQADSAQVYSLVGRKASPFPQHKGNPMWFGAVKLGKAYVSYHLMPLYMSPALNAKISDALRKRMQGKTCFNFKTLPDEGLIADLAELTAAAARGWEQYL